MGWRREEEWNEFMEVLASEVRLRLTPIKGYSHLLPIISTNLTLEQIEMIGFIEHNALSLQTLITEAVFEAQRRSGKYHEPSGDEETDHGEKIMLLISESEFKKAERKVKEIHSALSYLKNRVWLVSRALDILKSEDFIEKFSETHEPDYLSKEAMEQMITTLDEALVRMHETNLQASEAVEDLRIILNALKPPPA